MHYAVIFVSEHIYQEKMNCSIKYGCTYAEIEKLEVYSDGVLYIYIANVAQAFCQAVDNARHMWPLG